MDGIPFQCHMAFLDSLRIEADGRDGAVDGLTREWVRAVPSTYSTVNSPPYVITTRTHSVAAWVEDRTQNRKAKTRKKDREQTHR